jgi:predicted DNA-binding transcriptional regulator AlpA
MARSKSTQTDKTPTNEAEQPSWRATEMRGHSRVVLKPKDEKLPLAAHSECELWSFKTVVARTGLSRSSIYSYIAQGLFPRQRRLGLRRAGWLASEGGAALEVVQFRVQNKKPSGSRFGSPNAERDALTPRWPLTVGRVMRRCQRCKDCGYRPPVNLCL